MAKSKENSLSTQDLKNWGKNVLLFSTPAVLAFLLALQGSIANGRFLPNQQELTFAFGAGYSALLGAIIDLVKKYKV